MRDAGISYVKWGAKMGPIVVVDVDAVNVRLSPICVRVSTRAVVIFSGLESILGVVRLGRCGFEGRNVA